MKIEIPVGDVIQLHNELKYILQNSEVVRGDPETFNFIAKTVDMLRDKVMEHDGLVHESIMSRYREMGL